MVRRLCSWVFLITKCNGALTFRKSNHINCKGYSVGDNLTMIFGLTLTAFMIYIGYMAYVLSIQYIEITGETVTGVGLDQSFLMRAKPFTCKVSDIIQVGTVGRYGLINCLELKIDGQVPVICHVQDMKQAELAISECLKQRVIA